MKIYRKNEFKELMKQYPDGGIVFADSDSFGNVIEELHVTNGSFGATCVIPNDGEVYSYDWNINEYDEEDCFIVYDHEDILQMIKTLTSGLTINLTNEGLL